MSTRHHVWLHRDAVTDPVDLPDVVARVVPELPVAVLPPVGAHRRLRGPYTAAGSILRALGPVACRSLPDVVERHQVEVLSVAPELRELCGASRETLTSLAVPKERTRFYSRLRTLRISHGVVEFLAEVLRHRAPGPCSLLVHDVESADHTDLEFLSVLLRRTDPALLTVVVCTTGTDVPEPLAEALSSYAREYTVPAVEPVVVEDDDAAARRYVDSDCTLALPGLVAAYQRLPRTARALLHDRRADELVATGEPSWRFGAIAHHREHGSDPAGAGATALADVLNHCVDMGFYHATIDAGARGRAVIDWHAQGELWWAFTTKSTVSLAALGRPTEAEALYSEAIAFTDNPRAHMQASYARAMLYTRHNRREDLDHERAKGLLNTAVAFSRLLFEGTERAFRLVFNRNGLALVEAHMGNLPEALRLVTEGLELLDAELELGEHRLHRSVLMHNRAQVLASMGRLDEARVAMDAVIAVDPNYPDYYLDRGNISHRMGDDEDALADYDTAVRLGPPFPEAQYNRAELLLDNGEQDAALAGLDYVLVLDPTMVDAYVNRAGIHLERGELDLARQDAVAGLHVDPANGHLLAVLGHVLVAEGDLDAARAEFDRALAADPALVTALVARADVAHELGADAAALADLDQAVELAPDDPAVRFNRAFLLQETGRWDTALADLNRAAELDPEDTDIAEALVTCRAKAVPV
jgi:tetratricopeptide (TPR) repeat protein